MIELTYTFLPVLIDLLTRSQCQKSRSESCIVLISSDLTKFKLYIVVTSPLHDFGIFKENIEAYLNFARNQC